MSGFHTHIIGLSVKMSWKCDFAKSTKIENIFQIEQKNHSKSLQSLYKIYKKTKKNLPKSKLQTIKLRPKIEPPTPQKGLYRFRPLYRPGQPNWEFWLRKFSNFPATLILREINFDCFRKVKICHLILTIFWGFDFFNLALKNVKNSQRFKTHSR